jgi:hypothetical protein
MKAPKKQGIKGMRIHEAITNDKNQRTPLNLTA